MLDIDFLLGARLLSTRDIIYVYRSGFVRRRVRVKISEFLNREGYFVTEVDEAGLASAPFRHSLLAPFDKTALICDVSRVESPNGWHKDLGSWLKAISSGPYIHRLCLIIPWNSEARMLAGWEPAASASTMISEPEVTHENANHVLNFFMTESTLFDFSRLKGKRRLKTAFQEVADQQSQNWSLEDAFRAFENICFNGIDSATNTFEPILESDGDNRTTRNPYELHRMLAEFLNAKSTSTLARLLLLVDHRLHFQKLDQQTLVSQLHVATHDLILYNTAKVGAGLTSSETSISKYKLARMKRFQQVDAPDLKLWEATFRRGHSELEWGNFLFAFERLCRRYISRRELVHTFVAATSG